MMKQTVTLLGAKRSKGTLDNGQSYDSTKIYTQTAMQASSDTAGYAASEYNWGDSTNFNKISGLHFPVQADLVLELVTNGKTTKMVVIDVQPILQKDKA